MTSGGRNSNLSENRKQLKMAKSSHQDTSVTMTIIIEAKYGQSTDTRPQYEDITISDILSIGARDTIFSTSLIFFLHYTSHVRQKNLLSEDIRK